MIEEQRRGLFALREALRLCEGTGIRVGLELQAPRGDWWRFNSAKALSDALDMIVPGAECYLGDATQEAAHGGTVSWRFRVMGLGIIRWEGLSSRGWWDTEAKRREVQLMAKGGRTFRLDFATSQVYEVLK